MKKILCSILMLMFLGSGAVSAGATLEASPNAKLRPELREALEEKLREERAFEALPVIVRVRAPRLDLSALGRIRDAVVDAAAKTQGLAESVRLEGLATARDQALRDQVTSLGGAPGTSFWIINGFSATLPAHSLTQLAARDDVLLLELDGVGGPDQATGAGCFPSGAPSNLPWPGATFFQGIYRHGGEEEIQQDQAHSFYLGNYGPNIRVPIAIADSGFDLETDQWRGNSGGTTCWCPDQTGFVSPTCTANSPFGLGPHGEFYTHLRNFGGWFMVPRVASSADAITNDGFNTAEAVPWIAPTTIPGFGVTGNNFAGYAHGTQVAAIAAGNIYSDFAGEIAPGCVICPISGCIIPGQTICPLMGMVGVAPEAALHLIKIARDQDGSLSPFSAQITGIQLALASGAWVFNMSYVSDPYPLSAVAEAFDRAAHDPQIPKGMVIVGTSSNLGGWGFPDEVTKGYFNGHVVGSAGANPPFVDVVSPGSSAGPLAYTDPNDPTQDIITQRDGVTIIANGGYWFFGGPVLDGLNAPYPDETFSQLNYFGTQTNGVWGSSLVAGTSGAAPMVAGAAALVLGADLANHSGNRTLNQRDVRAILMNQADDVSALNPGLSAFEFGQGRLNAFASADFTNRGGWIKRGKVRPGSSQRTRKVQLTAGKVTEITLVWDRVTYPTTVFDTRVSNLQLEVYKGDYPPGCGGGGGPACIPPTQVPPVAQSKHPENNYERVTFTPSSSGTYTIRVFVPNGGFVLSDGSDGNPAGTTPDVPFSLAIIQN